MTAAGLEGQATEFANRITATVRALVPDCAAFRPTLLTDHRSGSERFYVRQDPATGIPLRVEGEPLLTLKVEYKCCLDGHARYLAVDEAKFDVFAGSEAKKGPLFRYHYLRSAVDDLPAAHLHVHAHRDGVSHALAGAWPTFTFQSADTGSAPA